MALLEKGADVHAENGDGWTPLFLAGLLMSSPLPRCCERTALTLTR